MFELCGDVLLREDIHERSFEARVRPDGRIPMSEGALLASLPLAHTNNFGLDRWIRLARAVTPLLVLIATLLDSPLLAQSPPI